jgi:hypothetical protein
MIIAPRKKSTAPDPSEDCNNPSGSALLGDPDPCASVPALSYVDDHIDPDDHEPHYRGFDDTVSLSLSFPDF